MKAFDVLNIEFCSAATKANTYANIMGPIMNNLSHIFYSITTTLGVLGLVTSGSVLIAFLQYIRQFAERISQISQQFNFVLLALAGAERVFKLMDVPPEIDDGDVALGLNAHRRFAGTGGADKRDLLSALCIEGNIIQNVHLAVIAEGNVVPRHGFAGYAPVHRHGYGKHSLRQAGCNG